MRNHLKTLAAAAMTLMLACAVGCSSQSASSGSAAAESSAAPEASVSAESAAAESSASAEPAASAEAAPASTLDPASLADGEYQIDVTLEGGSGKAYIESPAKLVVEGGAIKMVVVWSSPNYDQMIVDGQQYLPVPRTGNSTFEIPVASLTEDLPVQAETTAMSEPHMIDYVIHFDASTLQ